jgi:hypothetical protein
MRAIMVAYRMVLVLTCCFGASVLARTEEGDGKAVSAAATTGLSADWTRTVEISAIKDSRGGTLLTGALLKLSVKQGWLIVRRETQTGDLEWQIVLARTDDPRPPVVDVEKWKGSFELKYAAYFVRENLGGLRLFRERKTASSQPWPRRPVVIQSVRSRGSAGEEVSLSAWVNENRRGGTLGSATSVFFGREQRNGPVRGMTPNRPGLQHSLGSLGSQ